MKKKCLSKAILAAVLGGMFCAPNLALAATITGNSSDAGTGATIAEKKTTTNVKNVSTNYVGYNFKTGGTVDGISLDNKKAYIEGNKKTLTISNISGTGDQVMAKVVNGGDLQLYTAAATTVLTLSSEGVTSTDAKAYGFQFVGTDSQQSYGLLKSKVTLNGINGATGAFGLYADKSYVIAGTATSLQDFAIGSISGNDVTYGISTTSGDAAAIYAINGSQVGVNSKLKAYVNSDGAVAKSGASVTLGGWGTTTQLVYVDKTNTKDYAALRAGGGTINVDMKTTYSKGVLTVDDKTVYGKQTNINGNLVVNKESGTTNDSVINLSLTNALSTWNGVAYKSFADTADQKGEINLWLQNKATWTNELWGAQTNFAGSNITKLTGGAGGAEGIIFAKDSNAINIDNYSGATKVFYEHTGDGGTADKYSAGDIKIKSATAGSAITLITDNNGIDTSNTTVTEAALNALAGKLYYLNYIGGAEDNLTGYVQIAEGLTATSAMLKEGFIAFDNTTGKGSYEAMGYKVSQTKFAFGNPITGSADIDKIYIRGGVLREDGKYHLDGDTTITLAATGTEYSGLTNTGNIVIDGTGHDLTLTVNGDATTQYGIKQTGKDNPITITVENLNLNVDSTKRTEAINLYNEDYNNAATMNINGNVNIYAHAGATALMGIHAVANTFLNVDGNLTIKNPNDPEGKWGTNAYTSANKTIGNSYFGNAAVYVHSGFNACQKSGGVNVTGDVDIMAQAGGLYINGGGGVINIDGGGHIEVDPTVYQAAAFGDAAYSAMRAEDGYIYMNVIKDTEGAVKGNVTGVGNKKVTILGNLSVTCGADNGSLDPNHYESFINLGLNTADSSWKGVAHNAYTNTVTGAVPFRGEINLWLANGATWTNEKYGEIGKPYAGLKFTGNDDASYDGSRINKLVGGSTAATAGNIFQNDTNQITIDSYSGNTKVFYAHTNDGDEASDYAAGDIKIKSATEGSVITLITDNSGIDTTDNTVIEAALDQLAKKVYYLNASTESNLTGNVGIAEGLTAKSAAIRLVKNLRWQSDGQGRLPNRPDTETGSYTDPVTGNYAVDKYTFAASVLPENSTIYAFSKDTTITVKTDQAFEGGPWYGNTVASVDASSVNKNVTIDMQGHSLNVTTQKDGSKSVLGMTATGTATSQGKIEINNAGSISVTAKHDGTSYGTALFVNGGGEIIVHNGGADLENKVLTLRAGNTTQKGKGSAIKTMNGASGVRSKVIVDGLIDIVAKNDGSDGMYSDEAISVVASTVSIGGGTVKAIDGCTWAIRSYGEFATQNTGTVYINAKHTDGNSQVYYDKVATGAGTNRVVLEGKVGMSGSMNVFGSINVGFGTADSYYKGDIASAAGWGAATGYGSVNMWFTPGSYWTGNDLTTGGDTNIYLDGATWTGYSSHKTKTETKSGSTVVSGMNLSMKNASTWNNNGTSTLESLIADTSANSIFMTDAAAKDVTIDSYAGNTKVFYAHTEDGTSATHYAAGNLTIKEATSGSVITLVTDNAGMDMTKNNKVMSAVNALSGKLYYLAAKDGKTDLSGVAMIAEGLTSASVAKKTANISFYDDNGQGYIYGADNRYTVLITGDITKDNAYVNAGVLSGSTYTFDGDTRISVTNTAGDAGAVMAEKSLTIAAEGKTVSLTGAGSTNSYGIKAVGSDAANALQVTVNAAETEIVAKDGGSSNIGIYASGNADVTVNGKLTMHTAEDYAVNTAAGGWDYYGASAIYAANIYSPMQQGGKITVTDSVDLLVDANGVFVNGGAGAVTLAGGSIEVNKDNTKHYAALRAENGTINMNVNDGATAATNNDVNIKGNVSATCGAVYYTDPGTQTTINLGLNTGTSTWTGVAYNAFPAAGVVSGSVTFKGDINLWLANGATWTNEQYGAIETPYTGNAFTGSHISKFVGGSTADTKGYIFQKDTNSLVIDNYSGNTKVFYGHNDALEYQAGYIRIVSAAADSVITLATDNTGIDMTKTSVVNATLNSLANKLYYTAFIAGEKNLTGNVEILEGLTASSATLKSGEITFDGAGGQGTYQGGSVTPEDPEPTVGSDDVVTGTMADNSFMGSKVTNVEGTVIYDLTGDTYSFRQMNAAADAKAVLNVGEGAVYFDGKNNSNYGMILNDGANVTINGNVNTSSYSTSYAAAGISMMIGGTGVGKQSNLIINGRVTMGSEDEYGVVAEDKHGAYSTYEGTRWTGAGINMNQGHGSKITITDGLTMYVDGHGIVTDPYYTDKNYTDKDLAVVNVNGITNIHVESGEDVGLYAFANFGGTININMKDGEPGKDKVTVYGNAIVMKDTLGESENPYFYRSGEINLALTTADSCWTGAVDNTGTKQAGDFNLYLQNGGTWDYQNASKLNGLSAETMPSPSLSYYGVYDGVSHVANLVGGASVGARGVIKVNSDDTIEIANYSGNVIAIYEHDADNPTDINGGDMKISNAKVGSIITLSTDNTGVTSENNVAVLNALAGKLYYTSDNKNLTGYVQIAEGLTAASVALYTGNIAFDSVSGQGSYTKEESGTIVPGGIGGDGDKELQPVEDENTKTYNIEESKAIVVTTGSALTTPENGKAIVINNADTLILSSADPSSPVVDATNGNVFISGTTEITGLPGQTLLNVAKELKLEGVNLTASGDGKVVEMTPGSKVSIGTEVDEDGKIVASGKDVVVVGDVQNTQGTFNMALATANSAWTGNYKNEDAVLNLLIDNLDAKWTGSAKGDVLNVNINKGTWVNTGSSSSTSGKFNLTAGGTKVAFLDMRNVASGNVTVDKFSGGMTIMYRNDENNPTDIGGGDVTIKSAAEGSVINLWTDGKGLDLTTEVGDNITNDNAVKTVLNALAAKLTYTNYDTEGNITGSVGVGEGLTRPAASFPKAADLIFEAANEGKGSIDESTFKDNIPHGEIVYGDSETAMMRGAKMAMASTAMIWRAENNDLMKRMGDLRLRTEDSGVWAKYYSGKNEYDNNGSFNNKYKAVQVGVDTKLGHGWLGGVAFSYDDGRSNYSNGGNGDNKVKSLAAYATKLSKDGQYVDLIAKVSHLSNEYTVYNDYGYSLNGDYKNFGMSLSAEYGKKFDLKNGFYITPAAELTVGRINSKSYDAYSAYYNKNLHVDQDAFNSAVGRLSVAVGKKNDRATYYAKVGLAHEFAGGFDTTYSAPNEPTSSTSINFKDTWMELQLGGSVKLKNDATIYGTFGKTLGGEVKEKWRVDVGMLFTFNHISEFFGGKKKAQVGAVAAAVPAANLTEGAAPVEEKVYTTETAAVADANGDRSASVKVGDTEVGATMPAPKVSKGAFMLDEYVVTASRTKQRITDATADISVVTRKEIEDMHMGTVEEALRTVPGVQFNNYGGGNQINANISGLRINGSKDIAILVDGVKINAFQGVDASGYMYSSVLNNMNNVERIEVLRGAAGVLYGSNAKGGVINIITREVEENKTILDGSIGSFSRRDYKINTMGKVGKMSYNLYQGTFHQGDVTDGNGDKWEGFTDTVNFGGKFAYKFDDKSKLTLDYSKIKSDFGGTDLIYNNFYNGKYDSQMLSVRHDWTIDKHWDNTFVYRKTDEKRLHKQEYFVGNVLKNTDTDYTYQFITDQVHFKNKYNDLVFGFEYTKAEDNITSGAKSDYTAHDIKNRAFFINEDLKIMKGVTLSGGIRNEKPDGFNLGSYTTKSYKLAWDPTKKDTIYAGRSEFFILPSMGQLFNKSWGNANLKPAQGRTESIGYNRKFDQNNFMTVNWFQTKEDTGYGYDDTKGKYVNTENGISRGWNAQYTCKLSDKWNFNLGWTHLYTYASGYGSYSFGYYPKDYATFGFNYECGKFSGGLNGFYYFRAKDEQNRRIFPADNYGVFNLSFNYKPTKGFKTYLKIDNIFNKFYAEHTDAGNDPYLTGTGSRKYYAMPGRAFMIGMEFTF